MASPQRGAAAAAAAAQDDGAPPGDGGDAAAATTLHATLQQRANSQYLLQQMALQSRQQQQQLLMQQQKGQAAGAPEPPGGADGAPARPQQRAAGGGAPPSPPHPPGRGAKSAAASAPPPPGARPTSPALGQAGALLPLGAAPQAPATPPPPSPTAAAASPAPAAPPPAGSSGPAAAAPRAPPQLLVSPWAMRAQPGAALPPPGAAAAPQPGAAALLPVPGQTPGSGDTGLLPPPAAGAGGGDGDDSSGAESEGSAGGGSARDTRRQQRRDHQRLQSQLLLSQDPSCAPQGAVPPPLARPMPRSHSLPALAPAASGGSGSGAAAALPGALSLGPGQALPPLPPPPHGGSLPSPLSLPLPLAGGDGRVASPAPSPVASPPGAAADGPGDELPPDDDLAQVSWEPRLACVQCRKPPPSTVPLLTPTSSDWSYWNDHKADSMLFNVGLVADAAVPRPVKLAAVDLARNSHWFQLLMTNRHVLCGTEVGSVVIPCRMEQDLLELMVGALYASSIDLGADNVEAVYRAADAMQMPALMAACESYLASTCFEDPEADPLWINAVYDLACDLSRVEFASSLARHFACAAQRDAAGRRVVLSHILRSPPYAGDGAAQMELLRQGHDAAWNGQGPEVLLVHVMLEVAEALDPEHIRDMLDQVEWSTLQQEEVSALVDWCLQMPAGWALTPLLKDRALRAVAAQISGHHQRRYLVWRADVGRLPGAGQRLMSSGALTISTRRLYLCMERAGASEWGLFLCPPPDVSLYSRVAFHTLFVLGPSFERRVATYDVTISKDLRVGAGFGSRTIITEWMTQHRFKELADGSKHMTVGTIATHHSVRPDP